MVQFFWSISDFSKCLWHRSSFSVLFYAAYKQPVFIYFLQSPRHSVRYIMFLLLIRKKNLDMVNEGNTLDVMYLGISKAFVQGIEYCGIRAKEC